MYDTSLINDETLSRNLNRGLFAEILEKALGDLHEAFDKFRNEIGF
jgi:hypothetical protein